MGVRKLLESVSGFIGIHKIMKNYIPVLVVGKLSWKSSGIFNPNAFPSELRSTAMNCGDQLALIENSLVNTTTLIEKQKIEFLEILKKRSKF